MSGQLPERAMLRLLAGNEHLAPTWKRFSKRIVQILNVGLPIACQSDKPKNEPHLQEICDGLLQTHETDLVREYPFMRWSSSLTKPDWSSEDFDLWVELKYVREKTDIRGITEAIAADITKYGDSKRYVVYVIYDPKHLVVDENAFAEPIQARATMNVAFIR